MAAAHLDLLYRAALFCPAALPEKPPLLHGALTLLVPCLRQPARELTRSACALLARLASAADAHLKALGEELFAALLAAAAAHGAAELLPRVADALRLLLLRASPAAHERFVAAVGREHCGPLVGAETKQQLVQAALELIDDPRSFASMLADFAALCRASAPPPREAMNTTIFTFSSQPHC